ncbi:flagellar biosynthesis repressor FlbT, partial [Amaricoccus sp. HAR-UPW-R2A-40]
KLGPRERIMVNGVVLENGDRRARINILTPDAHVLRLQARPARADHGQRRRAGERRPPGPDQHPDARRPR